MIGCFTTCSPAGLAESILVKSIGYRFCFTDYLTLHIIIILRPRWNLIKNSISKVGCWWGHSMTTTFWKSQFAMWWCRTQIFFGARPLVCRWHSLNFNALQTSPVYPSHIPIRCLETKYLISIKIKTDNALLYYIIRYRCFKKWTNII